MQAQQRRFTLERGSTVATGAVHIHTADGDATTSGSSGAVTLRITT
jgi:hypothetical protein